MLVNTRGLMNAEVLKALWDNSKMQGLSFIHAIPEMTIEKARLEIYENTNEKGCIYVDYCCGRVIKVHFNNSELLGGDIDTRLYDRDNGKGAGERAIKALFESKGLHHNIMYSESNIINLVDTNYRYTTDDRPVYSVIFEKDKGVCVICLKPNERKIDLGEFFKERTEGQPVYHTITSAIPNFFSIDAQGFSESDALCVYNDLLEKIKSVENSSI